MALNALTGSQIGATGPQGPTGPAGTGGGGGSTFLAVYQPAHGFVTGNAVYFNGTTWNLAEANNAGTLGIGIVSYIDPNNFNVYQIGLLSGVTGVIAGQYYYVSDQVPGLLIPNEPTGFTSFSNPLFFALTSTSGLVLPLRPDEISPTGPAGPTGPNGPAGPGGPPGNYTGTITVPTTSWIPTGQSGANLVSWLSTVYTFSGVNTGAINICTPPLGAIVDVITTVIGTNGVTGFFKQDMNGTFGNLASGASGPAQLGMINISTTKFSAQASGWGAFLQATGASIFAMVNNHVNPPTGITGTTHWSCLSQINSMSF